MNENDAPVLGAIGRVVGIGDAIRMARRSREPRMSQAELAEEVKVARQIVNRWERGQIKPHERNRKVLQRILGINLEHFGSDELVSAADLHSEIPLSSGSAAPQNGVRRVAVLRTSAPRRAGATADFIIGQDVQEYVTVPPRLAARSDIRAFRVRGRRMTPRYMPNELVFVGNTRPLQAGDHVLIVLAHEFGGPDGRPYRAALIRRLVDQNTTSVTVEQYNPPRRYSVPRQDIDSLERILPLDELL